MINYLLNIDFKTILPLVMMTALALIILVVDLFVKKDDKSVLGYLSIIGMLIILPFTTYADATIGSFSKMVIADRFSAVFNLIFIVSAVFCTYISIDYLKKIGSERGEYYYLIIFATLGMMIMSSSLDLLNMYVGLELMALSFYVLVAFKMRDTRSSEGALKYFILGAMSSGILLYGISFTFGFTGSTNLNTIAERLMRLPTANPYLYIGIIFMVAGLAFKIAAFPFHLWAPDTYEGAPTPVTAFLSIGSKTAAFAVLIRVFVVAFPSIQPHWWKLIWIISAATMLYGSVVAIKQTNIIRMLAYSSIAHAGVILIGLIVLSNFGSGAVIFYLFVYAFMNMGAFTIVTMLVRDNGKGELISDYKGLASKRPFLAFLLAFFLLSLAGIPPTGGFTAKFFILMSAIRAEYYWLAAIAVISTAISLFFYAKVIFYMYMRDPEDADAPKPEVGFTYNIVIYITALVTLVLGIFPTPFIEIAYAVVKPLFRF